MAIEQPSFPGIHAQIDLRTFKSIRLAVSGDVALSRVETAVLDASAFQRLRGIRQLGAACWVFPTALHTRFDHSLGVLGMARRMIDGLRENERHPSAWRRVTPEQEQLARLLALLHDVTHIPFGHTVEDECAVFPRHDRDPARIDRFVGDGSEIGEHVARHLGPEMHRRFLGLMHERDVPADDRFILDLVTGSLGADVLDYLRRDAFFCNIALDADYRFLRRIGIVEHGGERRLAVRLWKDDGAEPRRDVLNELIRLLDNRYLLGERVYFHHAKLTAGAMLAGAVARAARAGDLSIEDLLEMGDDVLLWRLRDCADAGARALSSALARRALWKPAWVRPWRAGETAAIECLVASFHSDPAARLAAEDKLAAALGLDPGDVLLYCPHWKMAMKSADTLVFWQGGLRPLKDCSDDPLIGARLQAILDSHQNLWAMRAFINPAKLDAREALAAACDELIQ